MDEKTLSILDLNNDCMLEIMKYIIAGCISEEDFPNNPSKYADMENFARLDKRIKELLRICYKEIYYHREFIEVVNNYSIKIDFAQMQSTIANKNEGNAYWKLYANAIRKNTSLRRASLSFEPTSSYPDFPKHFQMIKNALEKKENLTNLGLALNGYSLDNLNHFDQLTILTLDVKMSVETLVSVCQSAQFLSELKIMSTEIQGRLSDIVPHCRNLEYLTFVPNPDVDGSEYAPLVELNHLSEITIHGAYKNGSLLSMFKAMKDWRRAKTSKLTVNFSDVLPPLSSVTMAGMKLMNFLSHSLARQPDRIELNTFYDFFEICRDSCPVENTLATMNLCASSFGIDWRWKRLTLEGCPIPDIENFISVLKQLHINNLTIDINNDYGEENGTLLPKLFGSMMPDGLFALKSICINDTGKCSSKMALIDKFTTRQIVRIKSITYLKCSFVDWESIELLTELSNVQTLNIEIQSKFEKRYAKALCNLLNTSQMFTFIRCNWIIEFKKRERVPKSDGINTLRILKSYQRESLNELFEGLAYRTFSSNEELDISRLYVDFRDVHKVSEIQTLKKLIMELSHINGIEKLSKLPQLEELAISLQKNGSLIKLFDQLATKKSPSLQCLRLSLKKLTNVDVFMISRIRSLRKLVLYAEVVENCITPTKLANSNIEDLNFENFQNLNSLQHLQSRSTSFDLMELRVVCKLKDLSTLYTQVLDSKTLPYLQDLKNLETLYINIFDVQNLKNNLPTLKRLVIDSEIGSMECISLSELENLESLTVSLNDPDGIHVLFNMKSLRKLVIEKTSHSLGSVYKNLNWKSEMKLEYLRVPIRCLDELQGITRLKSLKILQLEFMCESYFDESSQIEMGQLTELEFLYIQVEGRVFKLWSAIFESCKNLSTIIIDRNFDIEDNFVRKVHTLLKSIRDPKIQDPLLLIVDFRIDLLTNEFHVYLQMEYIDDEYLKVTYSFTDCYRRLIDCEF